MAEPTQTEAPKPSQADEDYKWENNYQSALSMIKEDNLEGALTKAEELKSPELAHKVGMKHEGNGNLVDALKAYKVLAEVGETYEPINRIGNKLLEKGTLDKALEAYKVTENVEGQKRIVRQHLIAKDYTNALKVAIGLHSEDYNVTDLLNVIGQAAYDDKTFSEENKYDVAAKAWIASERESKLNQVNGKFPNWGEFRLDYEKELDKMYEAKHPKEKKE
jgi:hypothetical protein